MDLIKRFCSEKITSFHNKRHSSLRRQKSSKRSIFSSNSNESNQSIEEEEDEEDQDDYLNSSRAMTFRNRGTIKTRPTMSTKLQSTDKLLRNQYPQENHPLPVSRKEEKKRLSLSPQFHTREALEKKPDLVSAD
jgi:hypothetical protein